MSVDIMSVLGKRCSKYLLVNNGDKKILSSSTAKDTFSSRVLGSIMIGCIRTGSIRVKEMGRTASEEQSSS